MKINISELFIYRQYVDADVRYCFDKKDYKICEISASEADIDVPYQRYIPLPQIDEFAIQNEYIQSLNNRNISRKYKETDLNFNAFVHDNGIDDDWWRYYKKAVYDLEKSWCDKNNINCEYDL